MCFCWTPFKKGNSACLHYRFRQAGRPDEALLDTHTQQYFLEAALNLMSDSLPAQTPL